MKAIIKATLATIAIFGAIPLAVYLSNKFSFIMVLAGFIGLLFVGFVWFALYLEFKEDEL
jgi:hypothetical protein